MWHGFYCFSSFHFLKQWLNELGYESTCSCTWSVLMRKTPRLNTDFISNQICIGPTSYPREIRPRSYFSTNHRGTGSQVQTVPWFFHSTRFFVLKLWRLDVFILLATTPRSGLLQKTSIFFFIVGGANVMRFSHKVSISIYEELSMLNVDFPHCSCNWGERTVCWKLVVSKDPRGSPREDPRISQWDVGELVLIQPSTLEVANVIFRGCNSMERKRKAEL